VGGGGGWGGGGGGVEVEEGLPENSAFQETGGEKGTKKTLKAFNVGWGGKKPGLSKSRSTLRKKNSPFYIKRCLGQRRGRTGL